MPLAYVGGWSVKEMEQRNLVGYGKTPPKVEWPGGARIAVSLVVNYEEGSERTPVLGDKSHETNAELASARPAEVRDFQTESQWEYGARAGVWRLMRILKEFDAKATFNVSALGLEFNPTLGPEIVAEGHDITGHGYRWIEQWSLGREAERDYIQKAIDSFRKTCGIKPLSWNTKSGRSEHTRELLVELGFLYDSDSINDDLPHYTQVSGRPWLVVPYALDSNDGKFWRHGWNNGQDFLQYLKDSFDVLYEEGSTHPRMLTVGLHSRVSGRPGRAAAVRAFLRYITGHPGVWIARRDEIARWWLEKYPPA